MLAQRQLTDAEVRDDIGQGLVARQLLTPAQMAAVVPNEALNRYVALLKEHRSGGIAMLPSEAFAPKALPSDAEVAAFYARTRANYTRPERRVIRYALFDDSVVKSVNTPSEADIAAKFAASKALYAASESRKLTQLIVPTEAGAKAVAAEVSKGSSLESSARTRGLSTVELGPLTNEALAAQSSADVANAAFAAARGSVAAPAKSSLGWHIVRVDAVDAKPARTLAQVRGEILAGLTTDRRRAALSGITGQIEDEFDKGGALSDAAKEVGVTLTETAELTADGQVYGQAGKTVPADLARAIKAAFAMEREQQPQLAELEAGKKFLIFDVSKIVASAPAPLGEIKQQVAAQLMLEKGAASAKAAAFKVLAAVRKGGDLGATIGGLGVPLPQIQPLDMGREQMAAMGEKVPAPISLFFSMAQGTVKLLPVPQNRGWLVVQLKHIEPGKVAANDPLSASIAKELSEITGREYMYGLRAAIRKDVGVKRNEVAIKSVLTQLGGGN